MKKNVVFLLILFLFTSSEIALADSRDFTFINDTQRTSTAVYKSPSYQDFAQTNDNLHYAWVEFAGGNFSLKTALMNKNGTGFSATTRATVATQMFSPDVVAANEKVYVAWCEGAMTVKMAEMNADGSNFTSHTIYTHSNNTYFNTTSLSLEFYNDKLYYIWTGYDGVSNHQIYMASSDLDGGNIDTTQLTSTANDSINPEMKIYNNKIYLVYLEEDGAVYDLYTASVDLDGTDYTETNRNLDVVAELVVFADKLYYTWTDNDGSNDQIYLTESNLDGSGFSTSQVTTSAFDKGAVQFVIDKGDIEYIWAEDDGSQWQVWTGRSDLDGTNLTSTKRTDTIHAKTGAAFLIEDMDIYYMWVEQDASSNRQIWTANGSYEEEIELSTVVSASVPNSLEFAIAGVTSGNACANSGGNASVTTTASTIPFGV